MGINIFRILFTDKNEALFYTFNFHFNVHLQILTTIIIIFKCLDRMLMSQF